MFLKQIFIQFLVLNRAMNKNSTEVNSSECQIHYCDFHDNMTALYDFEVIEDETQFIGLACTYLVCSVLAMILVARFLDPLSRCNMVF